MGEGVGALALQRGGDGQHVVFAGAARRAHGRKFGLAFGHRAGLIDDQRVGMRELFQ